MKKSKYGTILHAFKKQYSELNLIINIMVGTEKKQLFLELKSRILKFIFFKNSGNNILLFINICTQYNNILFNNRLEDNSRPNFVAMISKGMSIDETDILLESMS